MHSSQPATSHSAHSLLRDLRYTIIPHQMRGVAAGLAALDLDAHPEPLFSRDHCGGDGVTYDSLLAYTRPVVCVAAIHCRALLAFLGLQSNGSSALSAVSTTRLRASDIGIDRFKGADGAPLQLVSLSVVESLPASRETARAWAMTCDFAAQRLTDAMTDPQLASGAITPMLRRTFETVPVVVNEWFYQRAVLRANA